MEIQVEFTELELLATLLLVAVVEVTEAQI
jgi:hypothetical protein